MNAIQPSRPPLQLVEPQRVAPRKQRQQRRHRYRAIAIEATVKLLVNVGFSAVAIASVMQLLPDHLSQQVKLQEIQTEVKRTEKRVNRLRTDFSRYFDPQQAQSIMQEQTHKVDPTQRQIVWIEKNAKDEEPSH